jgi:hypothetical protein
MKLRHFAITGGALVLILTSVNANANVPKGRSIVKKPIVEHIKKEELPIKLKEGEQLILNKKTGEHTKWIITNMREVIIMSGSIKGVFERNNPTRAYVKTNDGNHLFMLQNDGVSVFDMINGSKYGYHDESLTKAIGEKRFSGGRCGDWIYFMSSDMKTVIWARLKDKKMNFFLDELPASKGEMNIVPSENGLEIYVGKEKTGILTPPK